MVVRNVIGHVVTDLNNAADGYGLYADKVIVLDGQVGIIIATYAKNDVIDFRRNAQQNGSVDVFAGSGDDKIYGNTGTQYCYDGSGRDYLNLGADNDGIGVGSGNDIYIGGEGVDLLMFYWTNFDGYEGRYTDNRTDITVELNITTRQNFGIYGYDIINGFEDIKGGNGDDTFKGSAKNNSLRGVGGDDTLFGREGNDTLNGGTGHDYLSGAQGRNKYNYTNYREGGDTILTFNSLDKFEFESAGFGHVGKGVLAASRFHSSESGAATTASQRFLYQTTNDTLWFDSNGTGAGGKVIIAHMWQDTSVTHDDIIII